MTLKERVLFGIFAIIVVGLMIIIGAADINKKSGNCTGNCRRDHDCQERCLDAGFCPHSEE